MSPAMGAAGTGLSAWAAANVALVVALQLVGVLSLVRITNTFFWSYWTLVYLRLSGRSVPMEALA